MGIVALCGVLAPTSQASVQKKPAAAAAGVTLEQHMGAAQISVRHRQIVAAALPDGARLEQATRPEHLMGAVQVSRNAHGIAAALPDGVRPEHAASANALPGSSMVAVATVMPF